MSSHAGDLIGRADKRKQERAIFDRKAQEIAEVIRPLRADMIVQRPAGERRDRGLYDSTGINANQNLGAGLFGTFCNPADTWFSYGPLDEELANRTRVKHWCETETKRAHKSFTPAYSEFYSQVVSFFLDLGAFGNAVFSSEVNANMTGFIDVCRPLSQCVWDTNADNRVDTMYRRWKTTAENAVRMFGDGCHPKTREKVSKQPDYPIEILHAVLPADTALARDGLKTNKPFVSFYVEVEEKHQISASGYHEFPYFVARWEVAAGEKEGRGPGEIALADMRTLNVATRDNIKAGNRAGDPPWGAPDEGVISNIRVAPGKVTYGAVNSQGKQLLMPLLDGSQLPWSIEQANGFRAAVKDGFYFTLMQLVGRTGMTATEVLEVREERMRLLAPYGVRVQNDFSCPVTLRRFNMLHRLGLTSPPPPEMAGRSMQVSFTSPFALAQKSAAATAVLRTLAVVEQIAKFDPEVVHRVNGDNALAAVQEGYGAPSSILRTDEDTAARREASRQVQRAAAGAEIADKGAGAAQKGAGAIAALRQAQQTRAA